MKKIIRIPLSFQILLTAILFFICMVPFAFAGQEVTLSWDPNTEVDLSGYAVYFQKDVSGPPYELLYDLENDEMADPDAPMITLTELEPDSVYYVAVTAYDTAGAGFSPLSGLPAIIFLTGLGAYCVFKRLGFSNKRRQGGVTL